VPAHVTNLHEYIAHCSPAAAGECACPAHAAGESTLSAARGDKTAMRPFTKLLRTLRLTGLAF